MIYSQRKRWPWSFLFVSVIIIIIGLAVSWNWVFIKNYYSTIEATKDQLKHTSGIFGESLWIDITIGSSGFVVIIVLFAIFFSKILREMKVNQLQKDFLANITHELKSPLASIELSSNILQKKYLELSDTERDELWQAHNQELKRLQDEIEHLLQASRWEQFQTKPNLTALNLEDWINKSINKWKITLPQYAKLRREGDFFNGLIEADLDLLNLIATNLIENALKFCGEKPANITIQTQVTTENNLRKWMIHFCDNGLGFDSKQSKKVFQKFRRLKHQTNVAIPGSGLGLFLARSAAKAMNMKLSAKSAGANLGATFTLEGFFFDSHGADYERP